MTQTKHALKIRNQTLKFGQRTLIMGIVNVTPDSFSGDGLIESSTDYSKNNSFEHSGPLLNQGVVDRAVSQALLQIRDGAEIIDIGGQSTRPGHVSLGDAEELRRVIPVIEKLRGESDAIISIDTYSPAVLRAALLAGADLLNSIWGLEKGLLEAVRELKCPVVIMHNKSVAEYPAGGVVKEVCEYLQAAASAALSCGLEPEQIILDPGIGFGKTADHNLEMLAGLKQLVSLGFPVLLGSSRKSTIGRLTGKVAQERVFGTAATVALGIESGVDMVRVHDVPEILDVVKVSDAVVRGWRPADWSEG